MCLCHNKETHHHCEDMQRDAGGARPFSRRALQGLLQQAEDLPVIFIGIDHDSHLLGEVQGSEEQPHDKQDPHRRMVLR